MILDEREEERKPTKQLKKYNHKERAHQVAPERIILWRIRRAHRNARTDNISNEMERVIRRSHGANPLIS